MPQREFPWIAALSAPTAACAKLVGQCEHYGMAARVSLRLKGSGFSESWLASRLGISRGHLSRILNGSQDMPRWMLKPIAWATGSLLIQQYDDLQRALRIARGETQRDLIERLAEQARAA